MKKIVITGGHLTPALAVIQELKKRGGWEVYFIGRKYATEGSKVVSAESKIISDMGVKFFPLFTGRLQRRFTRYTIPSLFRIPLGFFQSFWLLFKIRPDVLCSFGGYVSVPVVVVGWLLRVPIITHEQTVIYGLASKINAVFANKIAVSFPRSSDFFPKNKTVFTGNPIREEILSHKNQERLDLAENKKPIIYITGGNQGSQVINKAVVKVLPDILEKFRVIHQAGENNYDEIYRETKDLPQFGKEYLLYPYLSPKEVGWVFDKANLVVSRSGANITTELAALGKPSLLIPIPWTYQDEQTKNAQMLVEAGTAEILPQSSLSGEKLLLRIKEMFGEMDIYEKNAPNSKTLVKLDSASKIVDEIEKLKF